MQASRRHAGPHLGPGACAQLATFELQAPWKPKSNTVSRRTRHRFPANAFVHTLLSVAAGVLAQRRFKLGKVGIPGVARGTEFAT